MLMAASDSSRRGAGDRIHCRYQSGRSRASRKKEEILYVLGQEDEPIVLSNIRRSLHLIQQIPR